MSEQPTPDQEAAALTLLMEREIDKRVVMSLMRMIDPTENDGVHAMNLRLAETTIDSGDRERIMRMMAGLLVNILLREGSLMHAIRSKLNEHERNRYWK